MLMVMVENRKQLKTLIGQILFRPDDETDGTMFEADLAVSEIQKFLQINDDVLIAWMRAKGLWPEGEDGPEEEHGMGFDAFDEIIDVCDVEVLRRYVMDEDQTPLLTHFQPGLLAWQIEDHFDRMGGDTSRIFQYTTLAELSYDHHMTWYGQMQADYKESSDLRDRVDGMENVE